MKLKFPIPGFTIMKMTIPSICGAIVIPALGSCSASLVRVKPYERGTLAKPVMAESIDPLQKAMTEHAYFSREATYGGGGVGGGGCGCN
jgi:hypothetical protein